MGDVHDDRAVWFSPNNSRSALIWQAQISCNIFDFSLPWKIAGWQPSALEHKEPPPNSIASGSPPALQKAADDLHSLAGRTKLNLPIPNGIVPVALQEFLFALGCTVRSVTFIVTVCLMTQLNIISALTRTRKMRVGEFWRQLGLASTDKAYLQHAAPHKCPLCDTQATMFFHIQLATGAESKVLLETLLQAHHDQFAKAWSGRALQAAQKCDTKTIQREGAHLCFGCAIQSIPDLVDKPVFQQPATPDRSRCSAQGS